MNESTIDQATDTYQALFLAATQLSTTFSNLCLETCRQSPDKVSQIRQLGGSRHACLDLFVGFIWIAFVVSKDDILKNGAVKQNAVLRHNANLLAVLHQVLLAQIPAIDINSPIRGIVEALHQSQDGGFATAYV